MKRLRHPIRAIREPFGTAGLVVAMIALVAALGGTALAAAKLNGTQKKEVEKIAKKFAGQSGANGAPGAQGPAGPTGPQGATGLQGKQGEQGGKGDQGLQGNPGTSVSNTALAVNNGTGHCEEQGGAKFQVGTSPATYACNGQTGFSETLPSGKTETGAWNFLKIGESNFVKSAISFNIPLASPLSGATCKEGSLEGSPPHLPASCRVHYITPGGEEVIENENEGEPEKIAPSSQCPGSAANPVAEQGSFCMYATNQTSVSAVGNGFLDPGSSTTRGTGTTGTLANFIVTASGPVAWGTWAVTAP